MIPASLQQALRELIDNERNMAVIDERVRAAQAAADVVSRAIRTWPEHMAMPLARLGKEITEAVAPMVFPVGAAGAVPVAVEGEETTPVPVETMAEVVHEGRR